MLKKTKIIITLIRYLCYPYQAASTSLKLNICDAGNIIPQTDLVTANDIT